MENELLDCSLRAALTAAGTAATLGALRVRVPAAQHIAWTGVLVVMLLLPAWTTWGPKVIAPVLPAIREELAFESPILAGTSTRPALKNVEDQRGTVTNATRPSLEPGRPGLTRNWAWNWRWIALICYFTGIGAMVIRLAAGTIQVHRMLRRATFVDGFFASAQCAAPVTVGWFRPVVILPENWQSWPEAKLDAVLTHEREHVRRRDPLVQWLAMLNRSVFWFHPLAWWLESKLSELAEEACDAAVLRRGHAPALYSEYLIELARSVERAGGRVSILGASINGSTLSNRIRQILDSRPMPSLSRTRSGLAVMLCLFVLLAASACKLARSSKPASGQPTMNELMHKSAAERENFEKKRQALVDEAQKLTPDQARALEAELKASPQDAEKRLKLVRYYQYKVDVQGLDALTLWYIEHEPTTLWSWNINPEWDRAGYEQGKKLWLEHLKKSGVSAVIYRGAAAFLEGGDKPLAEQILLAGQKAYPNENWAMDLGMHYAQALLGSIGPKAEYNVVRSLNMKEAHGAYAQKVRTTLAASDDAQLLAQTGQWLFAWGQHFLYSKQNPLDFDVLALAKLYIDRALSLQPDYPAAASLKRWIERVETSERLRNTPPDKLSQSDRLQSLYLKMGGRVRPGKLEEAESTARELLAMAAQMTNDPEYGNAIFFANLTLSDVTLQRGDKRQAARYLLAASDAPPTNRLRHEPIDLTLARQLVDWGEREAVAQFLDRCAKFNRRGKELAEWAAQIRKGINPDLTPYSS